MTPILVPLHRYPVHSRVHFKILLFAFKSQNGFAQPVMEVPKLRGEKAFSVAGPKFPANTSPFDVHFSNTPKIHFHFLAFHKA